MALEVNFYAGTRDQYDEEPALDAGGLYALIDGLGLYRGAQPVAGPCPFDIKLTDLTPSGDNTDKIKIFDGFWESDTYVLDLLQFFESVRSGPGGRTLRVEGNVYKNSLEVFINSSEEVADIAFYKPGRHANFYSILAFPTDNQKTAQPVDKISEPKFTVLLQHLVLYEDYSCRLAQRYYLVLDSTETQSMLDDLRSLLESKISALEASTAKNLANAESRLRTDLSETESRLQTNISAISQAAQDSIRQLDSKVDSLAEDVAQNLADAESRLQSSISDVANTAQSHLDEEKTERSSADTQLSAEIKANKIAADNEFADIREDLSSIATSAKLYWETI